MTNWNQIEGKWRQFSGAAREKWAKLTDDDWDRIQGRREQLVGRLQELYGKEQEIVEEEVEAWRKALRT